MSLIIQPDALAVTTIWQEARGEPYIGKVAVGEVIRNRMGRGYSSDSTVAGTVLRDFQFSAWNVGDPNRIKSLKLDDLDPIVIDCIRAWHESKKTVYAKGAVLYCNTNLARPFWATPERMLTVIGSHTFYRD